MNEDMITKGAISVIFGAMLVFIITTNLFTFPIYFESKVLGYLFLAGQFVSLFIIANVIMKAISGRWLFQ